MVDISSTHQTPKLNVGGVLHYSLLAEVSRFSSHFCLVMRLDLC